METEITGDFGPQQHRKMYKSQYFTESSKPPSDVSKYLITHWDLDTGHLQPPLLCGGCLHLNYTLESGTEGQATWKHVLSPAQEAWPHQLPYLMFGTGR